jgi:ligand-binding sensor domain-containing protein
MVWSIAVDKVGHRWFGTWGSGVSEFDGSTWTTYTPADGLVDDWVHSIAVDAAGHRWFGTNIGVSEFDGSAWTNYTSAGGEEFEPVYAIAIDDQDRKWFGTWGGGVSALDGSTWTTYTTADGLASDIVRSIVIDELGHRWFGTWGGVTQFIPDGVSSEVTAAGGSVVSSDGSTALSFAPGALDADLDVSFVPVARVSSSTVGGIGHSYEVFAVPAGTGGPPVGAISGTYTVTIEYTTEEAKFVEETSLALHRWDGTTWVPEPSSVVDTTAKTITATPGRFSHWIVLGKLRHPIYLPLVVRGH